MSHLNEMKKVRTERAKRRHSSKRNQKNSLLHVDLSLEREKALQKAQEDEERRREREREEGGKDNEDWFDIDPLEVQALEMENEDLLGQLEDDLDAARKAEQRAVEISKLLNVFSVKVAQQAEQIEMIHGMCVCIG